MRVPGIIYGDESLISALGADKSPQQVANVAHLPGIVKYSLAMPDMHWGYGFPIGGWQPSRRVKGSFPPAAWATTSTVAAAS